MAQYDAFAEEYHQVAPQLPPAKVFAYTLLGEVLSHIIFNQCLGFIPFRSTWEYQ